MVGLARIAAAGETWQEAIDWLERARRANLQVVDALLPLPELYRRIGRPQQALEAAHDLNRRRPMDFRVLAELARAQQAANRSEDAARTLRVLYGLASERPPDLLWIAGLQRQVGDYEAARRSLDAALEILPGFVPAQTERVAVATAEGRLDEALAGARRLQAEYPRLGLPDALAGDVHMRRGEPREAASAYASALAKDDSATIALQLFRARTAARDEAALPGLVAWVEAHPAENAVRRVLADALLAAGRFPEAQAQYEGLAAGQPEDPGVLNNLAWLYQRQGDARGLEYAERAHRLAPEDAAILDTLGWVLLERGDPGRALPYLREAVARAASDPQVHYHLAVALARLGRAEEARHSVLQALRSGRGFAEEQDARALLKTLGGG
jgi:putative PEP-CTERM system TPR-repeat lipoprotein